MSTPADTRTDAARGGTGEGGERSDDLTDKLLDLFVYAPIGLLLDAQTLTPELARRGRQHTAAARHLGEMAVKQGLRRLDEGRRSAPSEPSPAGRGTETSRPDTGADDVGSDGAPDTDEVRPTAAHLAIPDYDLLAASQVVKRLDALDAEELEAVRLYEAATRDRRTILHKISRLQS